MGLPKLEDSDSCSHTNSECGCRIEGRSSRVALISRRAFLLGLAGTMVSAYADAAERASKEEAAQFPLVDAHSHFVPSSRFDFGYTAEELLKAMDAGGFKRMVVLGYGPELPDLAKQHPDRFVVSFGSHLSFRTRQARGEIKDGTVSAEVEKIGAEFEEALKSGLYRGIGEIHTYSRPISGGGATVAGSTIAPDSPLILGLLELAGRYGVPINIHCDDYGAKQMVAALKANPKAAVIWAHTGSYMSPSDVRNILRDHPNVSFDLSAKNPACCGSGLREYPILGFFGIDRSWQQLFEAYPERFVVGVDFYAASQLGAAREAGEFYRRILTQLTPATARKIGYENAEKLYRLK